MKGLTGIDRVMRNLNKHLDKYEQGAMKGFIECAIVVRRGMEIFPKIPVDQGNLWNSWTVITQKGEQKGSGSGSFKGEQASELSSDHARVTAEFRSEAASIGGLVMGFTANYAVHVHENEGANFQRPDAGAKFFEASLKRNETKMLTIIEKNSKIEL